MVLKVRADRRVMEVGLGSVSPPDGAGEGVIVTEPTQPAPPHPVPARRLTQFSHGAG
jgi:hypothetical protein